MPMPHHSTKIVSQFLVGSLCSLSSLSTVYASFTFDSTGCVNPSSFNTCWSKATTALTNCYADFCSGDNGETCTDFTGCQSTSSTCTNACFCVLYTSLINCALEYCWNEVYSCDYQQLVILAFNGCPTAKSPVPFFPAPQNAPGGCSCDISQVYQAGLYASTLQNNCNNNISNALNANQITPVQAANGHTDCACCAQSFPVSVFYNICPDTDPSQLSFFNNLIHVSSLSSCASSLESISCIGTLGFLSPGFDSNDSFVDPNHLPANGTASLSNTPGTGTITAPLSGASFTWSLGAVATVAIAAQGSGSGSGGGSGNTASGGSAATTTPAATGAGTGTATTSAPGSSGSKNAGAGTLSLVMRESQTSGWCMMILAILALAF